MMKKTILITGGAGFIGSNLAIKLKKKYPDLRIIALDNLKRRGSELNISRLKKSEISFIHGDVRNKEDFEQMPEFDLMIECSAEPSVHAESDSPAYVLNTNLVGTINCLEAVRKNKADIIFLSTSRVYPIELINNLNTKEEDTRFTLNKDQSIQGVSEYGINEDFPINKPRSVYGASKLCSELLIQEYISSFGIKGIINRCGVIAGPWQMGKIDQGFVVLWVAKHIFGGNLSYIGFDGQGKQVRDILHIDDLFDLIDIQMNNMEKLNRGLFNIGGGLKNSISIKELTQLCQDITGNIIKINSVKETNSLDIKTFITDYSQIYNLTGWKPKKNNKEIISDIADWIYTNKDQLKDIL